MRVTDPWPSIVFDELYRDPAVEAHKISPVFKPLSEYRPERKKRQKANTPVERSSVGPLPTGS